MAIQSLSLRLRGYPMDFVRFFRDEMPLRNRPFAWAVIAMATMTFGLLVSWLLVVGSWLGILVTVLSFGLIVCATVVIPYLHFYYLARGSRIFRQAYRALKRMERAVEDGLATPIQASEQFAAAREAAAEARTNQRSFWRAAFQSARQTPAKYWYERLIERELKRIVARMPLLERPYLAAAHGGYFDAQAFRGRLLQDANVLHCTRTQLVNLLCNLVVRGDERNEEYRKKALLRLIESIIWEARKLEFFDKHGMWTGKCEEGMCQELSTATAAALETPGLLISSEDVAHLVAYASSVEDESVHAHWKMLPSGVAAKLRMFADEP